MVAVVLLWLLVVVVVVSCLMFRSGNGDRGGALSEYLELSAHVHWRGKQANKVLVVVAAQGLAGGVAPRGGEVLLPLSCLRSREGSCRVVPLLVLQLVRQGYKKQQRVEQEDKVVLLPLMVVVVLLGTAGILQNSSSSSGQGGSSA